MLHGYLLYGYYSSSAPDTFGGVVGTGTTAVLSFGSVFTLPFTETLTTSNVIYMDGQILVPFNGDYRIHYCFSASFPSKVILNSRIYIDDNEIMGGAARTEFEANEMVSVSGGTVTGLSAGQLLTVRITANTNTTMTLSPGATFHILKV
ncbi:MAG: hypothetical protein LBH47_02505 [Christensenellaceae bacterium]|jgi:hypothetical protein|nr:hypothetical protein [Christensenellaceae bacterium]